VCMKLNKAQEFLQEGKIAINKKYIKSKSIYR